MEGTLKGRKLLFVLAFICCLVPSQVMAHRVNLAPGEFCMQFLSTLALRTGAVFGGAGDISAFTQSCVSGEFPSVGVTGGFYDFSDQLRFWEVMTFNNYKAAFFWRFGVGRALTRHDEQIVTASAEAGLTNLFVYLRYLGDGDNRGVSGGMALHFPLLWLD